MRWLDLVGRDPVPWLLDPLNPSSRFLTLQYIFHKTPSLLVEEQQRIVNWEPMQRLFEHWNSFNFWGRVYDPYFGGAVGNFGTLYLLAQLQVPLLPELEPVCENLLDVGRSDDGRFASEKTRAAPWLCYTGMALKTLWHFGYGDDLRTQSALAALIQAILYRPELLNCPMVGGPCRAGALKALEALLCIPPETRDADVDQAIGILCEQLIAHPYDWSGRDADWLIPTFPRYDDADIVELCHVLVQTPFRFHQRVEDLVQRLLTLQTEQGRWRKMRPTPALAKERIYQPSRWLTFEAIHTLMLVYGDTIYAT